MKIKIEKEVENPLLQRKEIIGTISEISQTPSRKEVLKQIAAITGATEDRVSIKKIEQKFGENSATIYAKIYKTKEIKEKIEPKHLDKRIGKEKPKEETPKAEPKEEPKTEEKKEEIKPEAEPKKVEEPTVKEEGETQ